MSLDILVPEGPWCVFSATRHQIYWGLTCNMFFLIGIHSMQGFCWYSDLILHRYKQTHIHTKSSSTLRWQLPDTPMEIYIFTPPVMCSQHLKFTFDNVFFSKIINFCKSHICWLDAIRIGCSCETQVILIEMV